MFDKRPNVLRFSGGAVIDREGVRAASSRQNGPDLVGAQRRPLQALVGPRPGAALVLCSIRTRYTADLELCNTSP